MSRLAAFAQITIGSLQRFREVPARAPDREPAAPPLTLVGNNRWRLEADYSYQDGEHRITVLRGFEFDLASVPRPLWWLIAPFDLAVAGPLVHDFLYRHRGDPPEGAILPPRRYPRREADGLFRRIMAEEGVWAWRRVPAYLAVRAVGWAAWGG